MNSRLQKSYMKDLDLNCVLSLDMHEKRNYVALITSQRTRYQLKTLLISHTTAIRSKTHFLNHPSRKWAQAVVQKQQQVLYYKNHSAWNTQRNAQLPINKASQWPFLMENVFFSISIPGWIFFYLKYPWRCAVTCLPQSCFLIKKMIFGKLSPASCRLKEWGSEIEGRGGEGLLRWGVAIDSLCGENFLSASDLSVTSHYDLCALSSTFLCDTAWGVAAFYVPPVLRECIEFSAVWLLLSANLIYPSGRISESNTEML